MKKYFYFVLYLYCLVFYSPAVFSDNPKKHSLDPSKSITQYIHKVWTTGNQFVQNSINVITQADDGTLIIGTSNGLLRFDGINFSSIDLGISKEKTHINVSAIIKAKDKSLWVGTNKGIVNLKDWHPVKFPSGSSLAMKDVLSLCEGKDGTIWIGSNMSGVIKYSGGKFSSISINRFLSDGVIYCMAIDKDDNLWVGTNGAGLIKYKEKILKLYNIKDGLSNNVIKSLMIDDKNRIWLGTNGTGVDVIDGDKITNLEKSQGLNNGVISSLLQDSRKTIWLGTSGGGLNRYIKGKFSSFSFNEGLPNDIVNAVYEDNEGNLWIGTRSGYLNQLKNSFITVYTKREGLSNNFIRSICEGKNGAVWIGTNGNGISKIDNNKIYSYGVKEGLPNNVVRSVYEDCKGVLWVGTYGGGLNKFEGGHFKVYDTKKGFLNDIVMSILEANDKSLWIGTGAGIAVFKNNEKKYSVLDQNNGLSHNYIRVIIQDKKGDMWIGSSRGINIYSHGKISVLESPDTLKNKVILSIYEDNEGAKWIGTYNEGLYRYKNGKFTRYGSKQGMLDEVIYHIFVDHSGTLWLSSNLGIFGIKKEKLDNYADGKISALTEFDFILLNELLGIECNGGSQPAGCFTKEGKMWFPTMVGAVLLDPALINTQDSPPKSLITGVISDNSWMDFTKELKIKAGNERMEFHYTALNYYSADNLTFKYKLEPFDKDWIYAGNRRVAYYTNIPYGEYTFKVIASNGYHIWSKEASVLHFKKAPHFYETFWFYSAVILLLIVSVTWGYNWRLRELRKRERELVRMVNDRTKELRESEERLRELNKNKDKFFSQISHDLKSVFMSLMGFSDILVSDIKKLSFDDIFKFTKNINDSVRYLYNLMNNLLDWSRVQLGKVEYKPNKLDLYDSVMKTIHVQQANAELKKILIRNLISKNSFVFADESMFYSIMNNLLSNSIKFTKPGGLIEVFSSKEDDYYEITVRDNGIGMDKIILEKIFKIEDVQSMPGTDNEKGTGLGLILCKDFVIKNKGEIRIESEPGKGSSITFTLPECKG